MVWRLARLALPCHDVASGLCSGGANKYTNRCAASLRAAAATAEDET